MKAFPHERAIPFIKLDILKLVALCSGRLTSVIRASQLGIWLIGLRMQILKEEKHSVSMKMENALPPSKKMREPVRSALALKVFF